MAHQHLGGACRERTAVDDQAHDLVDTFQDPMHADVKPVAFHRGFPDVTVAAVRLQGFVANPGSALVINRPFRIDPLRSLQRKLPV